MSATFAQLAEQGEASFVHNQSTAENDMNTLA
jgi:hypothetical protein